MGFNDKLELRGRRLFRGNSDGSSCGRKWKDCSAGVCGFAGLCLPCSAKFWRKGLGRRGLLVKTKTVCNLNRSDIILSNLSPAFLSGSPHYPYMTRVPSCWAVCFWQWKVLRALISIASNLITIWLLIQVHLDNFPSFHNSFIYLCFNAFSLKSLRCWLFYIIHPDMRIKKALGAILLSPMVAPLKITQLTWCQHSACSYI